MNAMTVEEPSEIAHFSDNIKEFTYEKNPINVINAAKPSLGVLHCRTHINAYWRETLCMQ